MGSGYSIEVLKTLEDAFYKTSLYRPMRIARYETGKELTYDITGLDRAETGKVRLGIEKFVGGGFAGQVYRVKLLEYEWHDQPTHGLDVGGIYAIKILIPPTTFSRMFRNVLYGIGFQGPFQLQVNPAATRAGALWQKFIRRGAKTRFGDERAVVDIYATFVDDTLGSCGELREWVEGRTWRLEVDDHMDLLSQWKKGKGVNLERLGSPEYRAKRVFMFQFVDLLHDMGCHEFARQYEWYTCKSQPNCLKRQEYEGSPSEGLVAVDFRAGLALLPCLPMSPGDFKLIAQGAMRGSLVQFDRGNIGKLEDFVHAHHHEFADMQTMLEELKAEEKIYRNSIPDVTHNHFRLLYSPQLWSTMLGSAVTGWRIRNLVDERCEKTLREHKVWTILFYLLGLIPLFGRVCRKIWGRPEWRKHYWAMLTSWQYLRRAVRAKVLEWVMNWHRAGRVDDENALRIIDQIWRFSYHLPLSFLPVGCHRFLTDWQFAKEKILYFTVRPVRLYFNAELREEWLREMVMDGRKKHLLSAEDADVILSKADEPFIQKYLKSLAVHVCTLPVTQIVSVTVAIIYVLMHPEMPRAQAWGIGLGIIALFQVIPISPGSLVRGFYVLYLVIRERNFKDYNIAIFLGFFKYVGYLAFPIQMTYRYPTMARFMAAHWATEAVHIMPVFGERGALLEHGVFCLFYNWPLTVRRRMRKRAEIRSALEPRFWHIGACALAGAGILSLVDFIYIRNLSIPPGLGQIWWAAILLSLLCGAVVTMASGGTSLGRRMIGAAASGSLLGAISTLISAFISYGSMIGLSGIMIIGAWRIFVFTIFSTIGAILTELKMPEPQVD